MGKKFVSWVRCCISCVINIQKYQFQRQKKRIALILHIMEFKGVKFQIIDIKW